MKTLLTIITNSGYMTHDQLKEVKEAFPNMQVVLLWGQRARQMVAVKYAEGMIAEGEEEGDYIRSVFFDVATYDKLVDVFNICG